jgi:hypothetical protein
MDDDVDAILSDIADMYLSEAMPADGPNGERSILVGGCSVSYGYRVDAANNRFYVGTFFVSRG